MAFNPMMNPGFGGGMPMQGGGGLMGQLGRGMMDGSLVGGERNIAANAVMDAKMTEAMAKMDGVVTPQERMAIMQKKFKAGAIMNGLRTNGMGNVSGEAMQRQMMGGPGGGFGPGGPGGFGGPHHHRHHRHHGCGGPGAIGGVPGGGAQAFAGPGGSQAQASSVGPNGSYSWSMAWSTGGTATAQAGNALAQAGPNGAIARTF